MLDKKISLTKLNNFGFLLCVFLAAVNVMNRYYYCIFIAFAFFLFQPGQKLRLNWSTLFMLVFSLSLLVFDPKARESITNMLRPFTFFLTYTMGISILRRNTSFEEKQRQVVGVILLLAGGTLCHYFLNMVTNLEATDRNTVDFWSDSVLSATGQACLACMAVGVIAATLFSSVRLKWKLLAGALCVLILGYNLVLAGRTLLVLLVILLVVAFVHRGIERRSRFWKTLLMGALVLTAVVLAYRADVLGARSAFEESNLYQRFFGKNTSQLLNSGRMIRKKMYLQYFWDYPLGGSNILRMTGEYSHDLYLDTYDQAGILALLSIAAYILASLGRLWKALRNPVIGFPLKQLLLCMYVAMNIQFWMEPILLGVPWLLASYCMMDGMTAYLLIAARQEERRLL